MTRKLLAFAAIVEIATAVAVLAVPLLVVDLLLGGDVRGVGVAVVRCFGVALLALGMACWPAPANAAAVRAMLAYNALVALYLAYLFVFRQAGGVLLWPAVALHAAVALGLAMAKQPRAIARSDTAPR